MVIFCSQRVEVIGRSRAKLSDKARQIVADGLSFRGKNGIL